jgi:hypothetical protein
MKMMTHPPSPVVAGNRDGTVLQAATALLFGTVLLMALLAQLSFTNDRTRKQSHVHKIEYDAA